MPQVQLSASINLNLFISQPYFVFQISQPPNMSQKCFCIQHSRMDLSFQERKQFVIPLYVLQVKTIFVIQAFFLNTL